MSEGVPRPVLRPEFRAALRERLLRDAVTALAPRPRRRLAWWRPAAALAVVALLLVATDTAAARSLPGEAPFAIKRGVEEVRLWLQPDRSARVTVLAERAGGRLADLRRAAAAEQDAALSTAASEELARTLGRLADEVEEVKRDRAAGKRPSVQVIERAEQLAAEHDAAIRALRPHAPQAAQPALERATQGTQRIRATPWPPARGGPPPGRAPGGGRP